MIAQNAGLGWGNNTMDPFTATALIGAGVSGVASIFGQRRRDRMNRRMFRFQKKMALHGASIRARDLEEAGLSKTLAAGNAATTNVNSDAANAADYSEATERALQASMAYAQVGKTRAEKGLTEELKRKAKADTDLAITENRKRQFDLRLQQHLRTLNIDKAMSETSKLRSQAQQEIFKELQEELKGTLLRHQIKGQKADNLLKEVALELDKLERWNREWYKKYNVPYDIQWDDKTRAIMWADKILDELLRRSYTATKPMTKKQWSRNRKAIDKGLNRRPAPVQTPFGTEEPSPWNTP